MDFVGRDGDEEQTLRYAEAYRKRLEQKINATIVFSGGSARPPQWLREIRAENIWRTTTGSSVEADWTVEDTIAALVVWAFGSPAARTPTDDE